jgi:hypothetical protein
MVLNLATLLFTVGKFYLQKGNNVPFGKPQETTTLVATILAHTQLLVGIILLMTSPLAEGYSEMGATMKNSYLRMMLVEHPFTNIIGIALITIARVRMKKLTDDAKKYKTIIWFYVIALLLFVSRIPWNNLHG